MKYVYTSHLIQIIIFKNNKMEAGKIDVNITFDDNNQIRVLSADKYRETENLKNECIDFLKSKY